MFEKRKFTVNISAGLLLKLLSMLLLFSVYREIGVLDESGITTTWLTLYVIVAGLSTIDFGIGSKIKNELVHDAGFTFNLANLLCSYLLVGLANATFFLSLVATDGITFVNMSNWFYGFSVLFFLLYPVLRFCISIIQSEKNEWLASISFFVVNVFLFVAIIILNRHGLEKEFYFYSLYLSFIIPLIILSLLYLKNILIKSYRGKFTRETLYLVTAKSFFFTQLILFLMNSTNDVLFNFVGDNSLINYQYGFRVLSISVIFSAVISTVIWTNLGSSLRLHYKLISTPSLGLYFLALLFLNILLMSFANPVMTIFFNLDIYITAVQLFSLAAMSTLLGYIFILTGFLNCLNIIDKQVFVLFVGLVVKFVLIYLVTTMFGSIEFIVVFSNIVSYLVIVIVYLCYLTGEFKLQRGAASV